MMDIRFAITSWAACAPGLAAPSDWQAWAAAPVLPQGTAEAPLAEMPAMQRRRLGTLGRMAAHVAWRCQPAEVGIPVIFASRYGDAERALKLLKEFALQDAMSPTDFTLSVHNAIGAVYSIARGDTASYCSISAGAASAAAGAIEAAALLADGAPEVLLVCYDAPLPGEYAAFSTEPAAAYAWAWRVRAAQPAEPHVALTWTASDADDDQHSVLPFGLDAMRFAASDAPELTRQCEGMRWTWSRHA